MNYTTENLSLTSEPKNQPRSSHVSFPTEAEVIPNNSEKMRSKKSSLNDAVRVSVALKQLVELSRKGLLFAHISKISELKMLTQINNLTIPPLFL